jgi:hypothetical protein
LEGEEVLQGPRSALALTISLPGGKDCVLPYIHLLYIKRLDRQIVLRFSMAEVRISARRTWHKFQRWGGGGEWRLVSQLASAPGGSAAAQRSARKLKNTE